MTRKKGWRPFGLAALFLSVAHAAPPAAMIAQCESCHGKDGNSQTAGMPSISGQPVTFLENQLVFLREGLRNAPVMQEIAKPLKDEEITALARHFSSLAPRRVEASPVDTAALTRGRELAERMHCGQCHLPAFQGREQMPRLAGQREDYLVAAMIGYRDGKRTGADTTMSEVLYGMSDADIRALAHYVARPGGA